MSSTSMGEDKGEGEMPQSPDKGASPLCTPSMGGAGKLRFARDAQTPSASRRETIPHLFETSSEWGHLTSAGRHPGRNASSPSK